MKIRRIAQAKVNLCLHVTGQRGDGYHLLDSLVMFADLGDVLTFSPTEMLTLTIDGPFGSGLAGAQDNLILRAARCFPTGRGCAIHLQKNLPVASGIGGGSADAAAALQGLAEVWDVDLPDSRAQLSLGADVPVCVAGGAVRMQGVGEVITPVSGLPDLPVVLVNPGVGVSTPEIFASLAEKENPPITTPPTGARNIGQTVDWLSAQRNDLQMAAERRIPVISDVLAAFENAGTALARMSGSGATCFGIFETTQEAAAAAETLQQHHPDWWVQQTILRGSNDAGHHKI